MSMVWPTLGSRMAEEQNSTEQNYWSDWFLILRCFKSGVCNIDVEVELLFEKPDSRTHLFFMPQGAGSGV